MFLVGGSHRELLIGGPAATQVVAMEGLASAGQILLTPETAEKLPRSCVGEALGSPGSSSRARRRRPNGRRPRIPPRPATMSIASCLPAIVRQHLLGGHAAPEHRTASVAFLQFSELDRVITGDGAEAAAQRLDRLVRIVQDACDRYEVCFLDSDISANGGKLRLSAGAPRVVGDDEERMLLALRQIIEADLPLPVQVGVNRGPVFTGEVGPEYRRWYAVMGDTVNLAARVMGKAPAGHIYATRDVVRQVPGRFHQAEVGPFSVKGKVKPVQAWDIGAPVRSRVAGDRAAPAPARRARARARSLRGGDRRARRGAGALIELVGGDRRREVSSSG